MTSVRFLVSHQGGWGAKHRRRSDGGLADPAATAMIWRLVGENNRDIGRSAQAYVDPRACRSGVILLRRQLARLEPSVCFDGVGQWTWRLELDGCPVAVSARSYQRRREAVRSLQRFRSLVEIARVPDPAGLPPGPPLPLARAPRPTRPDDPITRARLAARTAPAMRARSAADHNPAAGAAVPGNPVEATG